MSALNLILAIIGYISFQTNLVKGQAVGVAFTRPNGDFSSASSDSSTELRFDLPPLLNNLYQPLGEFLNGLATFSQQNLPGGAVAYNRNFYNFYNPSNMYYRQQYQQPQFHGYYGNYNRPYMNIQHHYAQYPGNSGTTNQSYMNRRPLNPPLNQNVHVGVNNRPHQTQSVNARPIPSWNTQTSNQNYHQISRPVITKTITPWFPSREHAVYPPKGNKFHGDLISETAEDPLNINKAKPDISKLQPPPPSPWSPNQSSLISEHAANPIKVNNFQGGLISETAEDPLNLNKAKPGISKLGTPPPSSWSTSQNSLTSEHAADPLKVNNFQGDLISEIAEDPLNLNKPDISKLRPPLPTPWSPSQSSLISEHAADPLKVNHSQGGLISDIVDDPLNVENTQESLINKPAENPRPEAFIYPDSPHYISTGPNDPSSLIDIRSD